MQGNFCKKFLRNSRFYFCDLAFLAIRSFFFDTGVLRYTGLFGLLIDGLCAGVSGSLLQIAVFDALNR